MYDAIIVWFKTLRNAFGSDGDGDAGISLRMRPANERWHYTVMPSLIGWAHTQTDP